MLMSLKRTLLAAHIAGAALLPVTVQAAAPCQQLSGWAWLAADPSCRIVNEFPGNAYLALAGIPNTCFSVFLYISGVGIAGAGSAGLTSEKMVSPNSGIVQTPGFITEAGVPAAPNEFGITQTRGFFTARSVLTLNGGKIYTADASTIASDGNASEHIVVTGGTGPYAGAKGNIYVRGKTLNNWGRFDGELCPAQ